MRKPNFNPWRLPDHLLLEFRRKAFDQAIATVEAMRAAQTGYDGSRRIRWATVVKQYLGLVLRR